MESKLLEALKGIAQCCDNQNPSHEQIYHIANDAINESQNQVQSLPIGRVKLPCKCVAWCTGANDIDKRYVCTQKFEDGV